MKLKTISNMTDSIYEKEKKTFHFGSSCLCIKLYLAIVQKCTLCCFAGFLCFMFLISLTLTCTTTDGACQLTTVMLMLKSRATNILVGRPTFEKLGARLAPKEKNEFLTLVMIPFHRYTSTLALSPQRIWRQHDAGGRKKREAGKEKPCASF